MALTFALRPRRQLWMDARAANAAADSLFPLLLLLLAAFLPSDCRSSLAPVRSGNSEDSLPAAGGQKCLFGAQSRAQRRAQAIGKQCNRRATSAQRHSSGTESGRVSAGDSLRESGCCRLAVLDRDTHK